MGRKVKTPSRKFPREDGSSERRLCGRLAVRVGLVDGRHYREEGGRRSRGRVACDEGY